VADFPSLQGFLGGFDILFMTNHDLTTFSSDFFLLAISHFRVVSLVGPFLFLVSIEVVTLRRVVVTVYILYSIYPVI
jgi:hypothetical protein